MHRALHSGDEDRLSMTRKEGWKRLYITEEDPFNVPKERTGFIRQDIQIPALAISCVLSCDSGCCFCFGRCCFQVPCDADRLKGRSRTTVSGGFGVGLSTKAPKAIPLENRYQKNSPHLQTLRGKLTPPQNLKHTTAYNVPSATSAAGRFIIVKIFFGLWIICQETPPFKGQA